MQHNKAVVTANEVSGNQPNTTGEVVRFKQENNGDHTQFPLTQEACDHWYEDINTYTDKLDRKQHETRRHFLPKPAVEDIVSALGRQMTSEDMDMLVGLDGEKVECFATKRVFQPVWWVLIRDNLLDEIDARKAISQEVLDAAKAVRVGQFFPNPDRSKVEHFPVSGVPYYWNKQNPCAFATWSPISAIRKINDNHWGIPSTAMLDIMAQRQAYVESQRTTRENLQKLGEIFENVRQQGGRRDRRPVFKPTPR